MRFHFEPTRGWINDPNGLCWFRGQYHAFFQHYPHAPQWGPMHWGHAVSDDLLHWTELPIALAPDRPYEDAGGCFSGSAVEREGRLWLFYTSVSKALGQTQSLAWSEDGIHFEKYPGNPVIAQSPVDPKSRDFRDPKVIPWGDGWRMVCGAAGADGSARVLLFASSDLLRWDYVGPLFRAPEPDLGPVPECPDLFPLGDRWVFLYSRIGEGRPVEFLVGDFDGEKFTPDGPFQRPEQGPDFYAAQTFPGPEGERLMMGWFYSWDRTVPARAVRAGALTLPRVLTLEGGLVRSRPIPAALPLMREEDPCLIRGADGDLLTDGERVLLRLDAGALEGAKVLRDGPGREVFWGDGLGCASFYWTKP